MKYMNYMNRWRRKLLGKILDTRSMQISSWKEIWCGSQKNERFSMVAFWNLKTNWWYVMIIKRFNDNTYEVNLFDHYNVSDIFNVAHLSLYYEDFEVMVDECDTPRGGYWWNQATWSSSLVALFYFFMCEGEEKRWAT